MSFCTFQIMDRRSRAKNWSTTSSRLVINVDVWKPRMTISLSSFSMKHCIRKIIDIANPCWSPPWSLSSVLLISRDDQTWILKNLFLIKLIVSGQPFFFFFFFFLEERSIWGKKKNKGGHLRKVFFQPQHGFFETFLNNGILQISHFNNRITCSGINVRKEDTVSRRCFLSTMKCWWNKNTRLKASIYFESIFLTDAVFVFITNVHFQLFISNPYLCFHFYERA